jgi:hypothetical protein
MFPLVLAALQMVSSAQKEKRDKDLAATTQRLSPWTGNKAGPIQYADPAGTAMQAYGASLGQDQAQANQAANAKLLEAQTGYYNRMGGAGSKGAGALPAAASAALPAAASAALPAAASAASMSPYAAAQQGYWANQMNSSSLPYGG